MHLPTRALAVGLVLGAAAAGRNDHKEDGHLAVHSQIGVDMDVYVAGGDDICDLIDSSADKVTEIDGNDDPWTVHDGVPRLQDRDVDGGDAYYAVVDPNTDRCFTNYQTYYNGVWDSGGFVVGFVVDSGYGGAYAYGGGAGAPQITMNSVDLTWSAQSKRRMMTVVMGGDFRDTSSSYYYASYYDSVYVCVDDDLVVSDYYVGSGRQFDIGVGMSGDWGFEPNYIADDHDEVTVTIMENSDCSGQTYFEFDLEVEYGDIVGVAFNPGYDVDVATLYTVTPDDMDCVDSGAAKCSNDEAGWCCGSEEDPSWAHCGEGNHECNNPGLANFLGGVFIVIVVVILCCCFCWTAVCCYMCPGCPGHRRPQQPVGYGGQQGLVGYGGQPQQIQMQQMQMQGTPMMAQPIQGTAIMPQPIQGTAVMVVPGQQQGKAMVTGML